VIRYTVIPYHHKKTKKTRKLAESFLCARGRGGVGEQKPYGIVMKFSTGVDVPGIITHAKFCGHRFGGFGNSGDFIS